MQGHTPNSQIHDVIVLNTRRSVKFVLCDTGSSEQNEARFQGGPVRQNFYMHTSCRQIHYLLQTNLLKLASSKVNRLAGDWRQSRPGTRDHFRLRFEDIYFDSKPCLLAWNETNNRERRKDLSWSPTTNHVVMVTSCIVYCIGSSLSCACQFLFGWSRVSRAVSPSSSSFLLPETEDKASGFLCCC